MRQVYYEYRKSCKMNLSHVDSQQLVNVEKAFDEKLFRKSAGIIISKLEKYLANSSIRGLAVNNPYELSRTAKDIMNQGQKNTDLYNEEKLEVSAQ